MAAADLRGIRTVPGARRTGRNFLSAFLALAILLTACTPPPPEPLRIAAGPFAGYESLYLARSLGFLDENLVRLVEYAPGSQSLRAFRNGVVDGSALTLDEVLLLAHEGYDPRVVAVLSFSKGVDMVIARPEIGSLAELRGRRIGAENTALGAYFLSRVLFFAGISMDEVEIVTMELAEHPDAYREGRVDALITYNLSPERIEALGAVKLFDSSLIPGEIVDVLVVRASSLARSPEAVRALVQGWSHAMEYLRAEREDAVTRMSPRLKMSPAEFEASLAGLDLPDLARNRALFSGSPRPLQETLEETMGFMVADGLLAAPVDLSGLLEPGPLNHAHAAGSP